MAVRLHAAISSKTSSDEVGSLYERDATARWLCAYIRAALISLVLIKSHAVRALTCVCHVGTKGLTTHLKPCRRNSDSRSPTCTGILQETPQGTSGGMHGQWDIWEKNVFCTKKIFVAVNMRVAGLHLVLLDVQNDSLGVRSSLRSGVTPWNDFCTSWKRAAEGQYLPPGISSHHDRQRSPQC